MNPSSEVWELAPVAVDGGRWLLPEAAGAAAWLTGLGLVAGDRIAVGALPSPLVAGVLQAALELGIAVVLVQARLTPQEVREVWVRSRAQRTVACAAHPLAHMPGACVLPAAWEPTTTWPARHPAFDLPGLVLFTSGTTGRAKAARLSRRAVYASMAATTAHLRVGPADTWLGCLPLDHIGGAMIVLRALVAGYRMRLVSRFTTEMPLDGVTGISLVPTMLHRLVALGRPWPASLRWIVTGGGPLRPELAAACTALGCAPCQTYGLTEHASMVTCEAVPDGHSAGIAVGCQVRIDADGIIAVRGASVFDGYEEGEHLVRPLTPDGWFATGDAGRWDAAGRLCVVGRRTDLIVTGGENVYPAEVEAVLERHPAIHEVRVRGIADPEWGQVVVAEVVAPGLTEAQFQDACAPLAGYKRPRQWQLVMALPRTSTGKLRRD